MPGTRVESVLTARNAGRDDFHVVPDHPPHPGPSCEFVKFVSAPVPIRVHPCPSVVKTPTPSHQPAKFVSAPAPVSDPGPKSQTLPLDPPLYPLSVPFGDSPRPLRPPHPLRRPLCAPFRPLSEPFRRHHEPFRKRHQPLGRPAVPNLEKLSRTGTNPPPPCARPTQADMDKPDIWPPLKALGRRENGPGSRYRLSRLLRCRTSSPRSRRIDTAKPQE
jgi:hypothetical protein